MQNLFDETTFKLATLFTESISDSKLGDLDTESIRNRGPRI
jgi:hypothetical protein